MRNSTVGTWDPVRKKYRTCHPSAIGSGDVLACIGGKWLEIDIKTGRDRMSPGQVQRKPIVERAGGMYWVVGTVDEFLGLIDEHKMRRR